MMEVKEIDQHVTKEEGSEISSNSSEKIDSLPVEVLSRIFQPLTAVERFRLERVCKNWQLASHNSWGDIKTLRVFKEGDLFLGARFEDLKDKKHSVIAEDGMLSIATDSPAVVRNILSRVGLNIRTLILNRILYKDVFRRKILSIIGEYCSNVEVLHLFGNNCTSQDRPDREAFLKLCEQCPKLNSFHEEGTMHYIQVLPTKNWKSLRSCPIRIHQDLNKKLIELISNTNTLDEFQATYSQSSDVMEALLVQKNLKSLEFNLETREIVSLNILKFEHLTSLTLTKHHFCPYTEDLFADIHFFAELPKYLKNLERLMLIGYFDLREVLPVFDLEKLETFGFEGFGVTHETLKYLTRLKNLRLGETVYSIEYTESGILQMIQRSENLRKLDIFRMIVTAGLFEQLVQEANEHSKFLEVRVAYNIRDEVLKICEGSKIIVVGDLEI